VGEKTPLNDPDARGAFVGLTLSTRRGHLFRAVLEAVAFGFRHHLDVFAELGLTPARVRVSDGGARSRIWPRIIADVTGLRLDTLRSRSGSALGVAFVAGMATGLFDDWAEIERFVETGPVLEPRRDPAYEAGYATYRGLYPALRAASRAADVRLTAMPPSGRSTTR
jgi:xylulokinase